MSKTTDNPIKLFNLDLHISVIKDFKNIVATLFEKNEIEITNWSISGHNWVFNQPTAEVKIINQYTWINIDDRLIEQFNNEYEHMLSKYDGFIVTHSPVFSLIYERYNKPIIVINSCRFDQPFCWTNDKEKFSWLVEGLNRLKNKGLLHIISNNRADQEYLLRGTGITSEHIPSLCDYTNAIYNPRHSQAILYNQSPIIQTSTNPEISFVAPKLYDGYSWRELYSYKAILHLPYEVSTMSMFEQYTAGVPMIFPTKDFYKKCHNNGFIINRSIYGQLVETDLDFWLDRADFYNTDIFKNILYFNSFDEITQIISKFTPPSEKEIMETRWEHRRNILHAWYNKLNEIFDIKNIKNKTLNWKYTTDYIKSDKLYNLFSADPRIRYIKTDALVNPNIAWYSQQQFEHDKRHVMITSHSDVGITKELYENNCHRACNWITINKYHEDPHLFGLPLGLTNYIKGSQLHELYSDTEQIELVRDEQHFCKDSGDEKQILCYMNFSQKTNPSIRTKIWEKFKDIDFVVCEEPENNKAARLNYLRKMAKSKFVICPPGNGEDTHRQWEALYIGCIPIVLYSPVHDGWRDLPILFVKSWDDITKDFLNKSWIEMAWREYNFDKLTCRYWIDFIEHLSCKADELIKTKPILSVRSSDIIKKHVDPKKIIGRLTNDCEIIIKIREFNKNDSRMVLEVNKFLAYFEEWNPQIIYETIV